MISKLDLIIYLNRFAPQAYNLAAHQLSKSCRGNQKVSAADEQEHWALSI